MPDHRFCIAPMLDWTDRHERYFLRLLTRHSLLYTEMVTTGALLFGDKHRHLRYNVEEHPVALQLGGSEPDAMARSAVLAREYGYDEVNINVGCPSDRVQSGRFGACLMADPGLVADCYSAMTSASDLPVTIKSRVGIDDRDSDAFLQQFLETLAEAGCRDFILHARIALLKGLSPKENRDVPPLQYDRVYRMKQRYPELNIVINGGIRSLEASLEHLQQVDGVMMGREAYQNPYILAGVDQRVFGDRAEIPDRQQIASDFMPYVARQLAEGVPLQHMTRHILGLFKGCPGGRQFRRHLSENAHRRDAGITVLEDAIAHVSEVSLEEVE